MCVFVRVGQVNFVRSVVLVLCAALAVSADSLTLATWNMSGPDPLSDREQEIRSFGEFARSADAIVLTEALGKDQVERLLKTAALGDWNFAVSDFSSDSLNNPFLRLEVAVISPHELGAKTEVDPYPRDDTAEMRVRDLDINVPAFIPDDQRSTTGARGWFLVEIPSLKLAVAAVHLKSSRGQSGHNDEKNSFKREAVAAALGVAILDSVRSRNDWSYVVAGDFNVAPGDVGKVGVDLKHRCAEQEPACTRYDQTHALLSGGLVEGLAMRNLTVGIGATYAHSDFTQGPIDNILATGPLLDGRGKVTAVRGGAFGSDHHAVRVTITSK